MLAENARVNRLSGRPFPYLSNVIDIWEGTIPISLLIAIDGLVQSDAIAS